MASKIVPFYPIFTALDGSPLDSGYVYIGAEDLNPEILANQINVYWDAALTIPAAQPIRTINGYPSRSGTAAAMYVAESEYSVVVRDKNSGLVNSTLSDLNVNARLAADLAAETGSTLVGHKSAATGAVAQTVFSMFEYAVRDLREFLPASFVVDGSVDYATEIQAAIDAVGSNGMLRVDGGSYQFTALTISNDITFIGNGTLTGPAVSGSKPTRSALVATNEAGRLSLLQAYYTGEITLGASVTITGNPSISKALIKGAARTLSVVLDLNLDDVSFHDVQLEATRNSSVNAINDLITTDSPSVGLFAQQGGLIVAQSAIVVATTSRGCMSFMGGIVDITSGEVWDAGNAGLYALQGGTIIAPNVTVDGSVLSNLLTNYGGQIDFQNGLSNGAGGAGAACESNGAIHADGASFTNNTNEGVFVTFGGMVQAANSTITSNGTYAAYANGSGIIYLNGASLSDLAGGDLNTGVSGQIIRAIGSGYIYATAPGAAGFVDVPAAGYFPGFNRQGAGAAYVGTNAQDDAKIGVYNLMIPLSPPNIQIASGVAAPTSSWATVDTEGFASTDDLDDIDPTDCHIWYIRTASSGRDVQLVHNAATTNPILLNGGVSRTLASVNEIITLIYQPASGFWIEPE